MGEAAEKLSAKLGIDTTDLKAGLAAANRALKVLESGFKSSAAALDDWTQNATGLEARIKSLTSQIDIQKLKVSALKEEHKRLVEANGANSRAAQDAEIKFNNETATLNRMELELKNTDSALQKLSTSQQNVGNNAAASSTKFSNFVASAKEAAVSIGLAIGAVTAAWYTVNKVLDETVGAIVAYADQVRRLSSATGASAEDSSRLIQVMDDLKISYEDIEKTVAKNGKTYDYSVEGLARMADEYVNLTNEQDRAAFMQERFGKNWITFVPAMEKGGKALRDANAAVSENLILTQKAVDQARQYEISMDNLSDTLDGLKISMGNLLVGPMSDLLGMMQKQIDAGFTWRNAIAPLAVYDQIVGLKNAHTENAAAVDAANQKYMEQTSALDQNSESAKANAEALNLISEGNKQLLGLIGQMQSAQEIYDKRYQEIAASENLTDEQRKQQFAALAAEHDLATRKIVLNLLEQRLAQDGLTSDELNFLLKNGQEWGVYSESVVREARKAISEVDALEASINSIPTNKTMTISVMQVQAQAIKSGNFATYDRLDGARASGGPVKKGSTYLVGERGPERFTPNESGIIIPNGTDSDLTDLSMQLENQMRSLVSVLQTNSAHAENSSSIKMGDVIVNIPGGTTATPAEIGRATQTGVLNALRASGAL